MTGQNNNTSQRLTGFRAFIPFYILYDLDLDGHHFRLYGQIEQMESNPNPKVNADFSYTWIAKELGISRRQAIRIANLLREKGYIERIQISLGKWRWNTVKKPVLQDSFDDDEGNFGSDTACHRGSDTACHRGSDTACHPKILEVKSLEVKSKDLKTLVDSSNTTIKKPKISKVKDYTQDPRFMSVYNAYPKKVKPRDAYKAFQQIVGNDDALLARILVDLEERKTNHSQWLGDRQYISHLATYLRQGEYEGEIINTEADKKVRVEEQKKLANERVKAQDEASRKRAAIELANNHAKQSDANAYRQTIVKSHGIPEGLRNLKRSIGLRS